MDEGRRRKILVVDDDDAMRGSIAEILSRAGFDVLAAPNGIEGLRHFRAHRIDLAIVDIFMPDKDGFETLMEMRRHALDAKVLAISGGGGLGTKEVLSMAEKLRAAATLSKPFTREQLLAAVAETLNPRPS